MGRLEINVSGGQSKFGNVVQGDHNTVQSEAEIRGDLRSAFSSLEDHLVAEGLRQGESAQRVEELKERVVALESALVSKEPEKAKSLTQTIFESFAWAAPAIRKVIEVFFPALLPG